MNKKFLHYNIKLLIYSSLIWIGISSYSLFLNLPINLLYIGLLICCFFIIYTLSHKNLLRVLEKKPNLFIRKFMLMTGIKMFFFITILLISLIFSLYKTHLAITFLVLYVFFAVFELISLLKIIRREKR